MTRSWEAARRESFRATQEIFGATNGVSGSLSGRETGLLSVLAEAAAFCPAYALGAALALLRGFWPVVDSRIMSVNIETHSLFF
jgi:hypothetical protein